MDPQTPATGANRDPDDTPRPSVALGRAIRRARADRFTLAQLSARSGVSAGLLSLIERGKGNPSINTLAAIANALSVSLPELVADAIAPEDDADGLVAAPEPVAGAVADGSAGTGGSWGTAAKPELGSRAWRSSMVLRGGEEAHVRVLDGTLELTLHDRTGDVDGEPALSVDLRLRSGSPDADGD